MQGQQLSGDQNSGFILEHLQHLRLYKQTGFETLLLLISEVQGWPRVVFAIAAQRISHSLCTRTVVGWTDKPSTLWDCPTDQLVYVGFFFPFLFQKYISNKRCAKETEQLARYIPIQCIAVCVACWKRCCRFSRTNPLSGSFNRCRPCI